MRSGRLSGIVGVAAVQMLVVSWLFFYKKAVVEGRITTYTAGSKDGRLQSFYE